MSTNDLVRLTFPTSPQLLRVVLGGALDTPWKAPQARRYGRRR